MKIVSTLFPAFDALHGSLTHQIMVIGTILADKHLFFIYLPAFILLAMAVRLAESNPKKRKVKTLLWADVISTFALTFIVGGAMIYNLKHSLAMPRPFVGLSLEEIQSLGALIEKGEDNMSFPSGHAAFATMVAVSIWPVLGKVVRLLACLFVVWVACSRVVLGLHYPVDVIGSILIVLPIAWVIRFYIRKTFKESRTIPFHRSLER